MSGTPFNALKEGAKQIGATLFKTNDFEYFETIFYDDKISVSQHND